VPPERLAEEFGVSRPVSREAFRALQGKGLLIARPKAGTRVSDPRTWNYLDPQVITWRLESDRRTDLSGSKMFECLSSVIATAVRTWETLVFPVVEAMCRGLELHRQLVQDIMTDAPELETTSRRLIVDAHEEANRALGVWGSGADDQVPSRL